jgi:hypothetical protein
MSGPGSAPIDTGSIPLSERAPFVWFAPLARLRYPLLGWTFLVLAAAVGVERIRLVVNAPQADAGAVLWAVAWATVLVCRVLLPAALLWRDPLSMRYRPILVAGLAAFALEPVINAFAPAFGDIAGWLALIGVLLIGYGLLRMRARGATRWWILVVVAGLLVTIALLEAVGVLEFVEDPLVFLATRIVTVLASSFSLWVPAAAWVDGDEPRRFWSLLALALPLQLAGGLLALITLTFAPSSPDLATWTSVIGVGLTLAVSLTRLAAFGLFAPPSPLTVSSVDQSEAESSAMPS